MFSPRASSTLIKLEGRTPLSFEVFHNYISQIKGESLKELMIAIKGIMIEEAGGEDGESVRIDSTVVETDNPLSNE